MFKLWLNGLLLVWIICSMIQKFETTRTENGSSLTSPRLLTFSSFFEEVTAPLPELEWNLFNVDLDVMEMFIKSQRKVREYLAGIKNDFRRFVVENQIKFCPYVAHCDLTFKASTDLKSCCQPCSCESFCDSEQRCCPAAMNETKFIYNSNATIPFNGINLLVHPGTTDGEEPARPTCNLRHLTIRPSYYQTGYMAVSDCADYSDLELLYNCTRPYTDNLRVKFTLPVYSNVSLTVFRNKFCALCNGVFDEDIMYFRPLVSCTDMDVLLTQISSEHDLVKLIFANESCDLKYTVSDNRVQLKECKYFISTCNVTASWKQYDIRLDIACNLYESRFTHGNYVFRNVFCAMCNGKTPHTITCPIQNILATDVFSFSGLLNLDFDQGFSTTHLAQNRNNQGTSCNTNQLYDALTNRCKDIYCPEMRALRNGDCINVYNDVGDFFTYNMYIRLKPLSTLTSSDVFANGSNWLFNIESVFRETFSQILLCETQMLFKLNIDFSKSTLKALSDSKLQYVDAKVLLREWSKEPWTVVDKLLQLHGTDTTIHGENNSTITFTIYVMDNDVRIFDITKMLLHNHAIQSKFVASSTPEKRIEVLSRYALTDTDGSTLLPYTDSTVFIGKCYHNNHEINVIKFSSCPKVNLSKEDIPWMKDLDGIKFNGLKIPSNAYYFIDHLHIMICTEMFKKIVDHLTPQRSLTTEVILSIICSSMSILSLLLTLIVFCIIPKLRTPLPGKNNMALTFNLMIAQILYLVGSLGPFEQFSTSCKVVGALIHFIWLCAVFWMNMCTYHMYRVLTNTLSSISKFGLKTFLFYTSYVFIMSGIFVSANMISSTLTSGNIGYGGKFCYIISRENLLFTFALPTLIIVTINLSLFLAVVIKLKRTPNIRKHVNNERNDIVILAKLSTITGLTWAFGFLSIWSGIQTFSYIFTVFNAGQGVFILFAFVLNRKVLNFFRDWIKNSNKRHQSRSDLSNRTNSSKL